MTAARVLLIDDDDGTRQIMGFLLKRAGYDVVTAPSGTSGIDQARRVDFDVILIDWRLPDISGIDVLDRLVAAGNRSIRVITTAFPNPANDGVVPRGAAFVAEGPFWNDEIVEAVSTAIAMNSAQQCAASDVDIAPRVVLETDDRIMSVVSALEKDPARSVLKVIAPRVGLSVGRLRHLFLECVGVPFSRYAVTLRTSIAARDLRLTDGSVQRVAGALGWSDVRHFRRLFKRRFGMSPADYRKAFGRHSGRPVLASREGDIQR
jgi:YesN/AraC family two-component response regulator